MVTYCYHQYFENYLSTKSNLHIQFNPHLNINGILAETENIFLKFIWKHNRPRTGKKSWKNKNTAIGISIPNLKLYYKALLIKQHDTVIKTGSLINRIELETQVQTHVVTARWFLPKRSTIHIWEKQHQQQMLLVKLDSYIQNKEIDLISYSEQSSTPNRSRTSV